VSTRDCPFDPHEDRTFKGYELYAVEIEKQRTSDKAKLAKYKDRAAVTTAVLLAGLTMLALSVYLLVTTPACYP
jgi:hypothetical protein